LVDPAVNQEVSWGSAWAKLPSRRCAKRAKIEVEEVVKYLTVNNLEHEFGKLNRLYNE
jgi:hypothetical protein